MRKERTPRHAASEVHNIPGANFDALILAGGFAVRMGIPQVPKALLAVQGRPLMDYHLKQLRETPEVERVLITTNKRFRDQISHYLRSELKEEADSRLKYKLIVEPALRDDDKLGVTRAIANAISVAGISNDLIVMCSDTRFTFSIAPMIMRFLEERKAVVMLYDVGSLQSARRYGVVQLQGDRIVSFEEKPARPKSSTINAGVYVLPKEDLHMVSEYLACYAREPDEFMGWYVTQKPALGLVPKPYWIDIGTREDFERANRYPVTLSAR